MTHFLFFTEAGDQAGLGHLMRCTALARALQLKRPSSHITFIVDAPEGFIEKFVPSACDVEYAAWQHSAATFKDRIAAADFTVIDSYRATIDVYVSFSHAAEGRLVMIDDDVRINYPRGVILNPSAGGENLPYILKEETRLLAGATYVLLREPFWSLPQRKTNQHINSVLLTFGGGGSSPVWRTDLESRLKREPTCRIISLGNSNREEPLNATKVRDRMLETDLCISAGGQTLYELAACGTPAIAVSVAENQRYNLLHLAQAGFLDYAGKSTETNIIEKIMVAVRDILPQAKRQERAMAGQKLITGRGALETAKTLLNSEVIPCRN